jgi:hypothetical protein
MSRLRGLAAAFGEPAILLVLSIGGLSAALMGTGLLKPLGVLAAASPLLAITRHCLRARRASQPQRTRP